MRSTAINKCLCLLLAGMMSASTPVLASEPTIIAATDVSIIDGVLTGTVLNAEARPVAGLNVQVLQDSRVVATASSDDNGQFAIRGLRHGSHVIQVGARQQPVRFWGSQIAPPSAVKSVAIVVDEHVVRGQAAQGLIFGGFSKTVIPLSIFGGTLAATAFTTVEADDIPPASP